VGIYVSADGIPPFNHADQELSDNYHLFSDNVNAENGPKILICRDLCNIPFIFHKNHFHITPPHPISPQSYFPSFVFCSNSRSLDLHETPDFPRDSEISRPLEDFRKTKFCPSCIPLEYLLTFRSLLTRKGNSWSGPRLLMSEIVSSLYTYPNRTLGTYVLRIPHQGFASWHDRCFKPPSNCLWLVVS